MLGIKNFLNHSQTKLYKEILSKQFITSKYYESKNSISCNTNNTEQGKVINLMYFKFNDDLFNLK